MDFERFLEYPFVTGNTGIYVRGGRNAPVTARGKTKQKIINDFGQTKIFKSPLTNDPSYHDPQYLQHLRLLIGKFLMLPHGRISARG